VDETTPLLGVDNQGNRTVRQTTKSVHTIVWIQPYCSVRLPVKTRRTRDGELSLPYNFSQEAACGELM